MFTFGFFKKSSNVCTLFVNWDFSFSGKCVSINNSGLIQKKKSFKPLMNWFPSICPEPHVKSTGYHILSIFIKLYSWFNFFNLSPGSYPYPFV